ncbi:MAG: DegT/DnrJ/EryC1/StrS family aminotransferase [Candidatus Competibacter sp.]|nr:DegT/DnrJ/EryC1/StrS family aminotransferase [Candidatus Competibacter sp.]
MDLLLDASVAIDLCAPRIPWYGPARDALARCAATGGRVWLYAGSVQTLQYSLYDALRRLRPELSDRQRMRLAKSRLADFARDKHWLAALAGEGAVFDGDDPEGEQLVRALERFEGNARLLSRDGRLAERYPDRVIAPEAYLALDRPPRSLEFIDLKAQQDTFRPALERNVHRVLHHGQYIMGPEIAELETALAEYVGVKHCISVASGTDSLEIALRALGIGPGDEVITVPFTWISSAEIVGLVGATPVFVDIEPESFNIDVERIEAAITPRAKAILPVSLFGQMPDYPAINALAARHGLTVIEDAAQSFGATQHGRRSCGVTTLASTSFFPAKPLGCYGDGGALFTNDEGLAERMRAIRTHGGIRRHHHPLLGTNGRFDTLQAAILLAKWPCFQREVEARGRIGARYSERLDEVGVVTPRVMPGNTHVYAQYTIRAADRDRMSAALKAQGIPTAVYYPKCLHEQPVFAPLGYQWGDFPEAERASREVLSLPMHPWLTEREQDRVVVAVLAAVAST